MALQREQVIDALRTVFDPEIPINVVDLGLVYGIDIVDDRKVTVRMTMTAPQCPMSGYLTQQAEQAVRSIPGVQEVQIELAFDPPWDPSMIKEDALKTIGIVSDTPASPAGDGCPPEK